MFKKIIRGYKASSNVEIFNNRSVNDLMPSLVHLSDETCREALKAVCGKDFGTKQVLDTKHVCEALNLDELIVRRALYGEASEILRRHMVRTRSRVNLWTPRSVVILAAILHHRSEACRGISLKVVPHCAMKVQKPQKTQDPVHAPIEVIPLPVKAKVQAPHPIPVEAHVLETPKKVPAPNEISVILQPGTLLRVATAF